MTHSKRRWTDQEVETLVELWVKDVPIPEIAARLGREPPVVRAKVSSLRARMPRLRKFLKIRAVYPNYKLTARQIPGIRKDKRSLRLIGLDYDVSPVTIFKIKKRDTWKDV